MKGISKEIILHIMISKKIIRGKYNMPSTAKISE